MRAASAIAAVGLVAAAVATPAYAGGSHTRVVHRTFDERPAVSQVHGLGPGCPDFVGTLVERRHLEQSGYIRHDVARISTVVTATVTLRPANTSAPSFRGSYRSVQAGVFTHHGHVTRRSSTLTVGTIHGSDGSTYGTVEVARVWHDKDGQMHRTDALHCD